MACHGGAPLSERPTGPARYLERAGDGRIAMAWTFVAVAGRRHSRRRSTGPTGRRLAWQGSRQRAGLDHQWRAGSGKASDWTGKLVAAWSGWSGKVRQPLSPLDRQGCPLDRQGCPLVRQAGGRLVGLVRQAGGRLVGLVRQGCPLDGRLVRLDGRLDRQGVRLDGRLVRQGVRLDRQAGGRLVGLVRQPLAH
jgi:hypothetical protein